MLRKIYVRKCF